MTPRLRVVVALCCLWAVGVVSCTALVFTDLDYRLRHPAVAASAALAVAWMVLGWLGMVKAWESVRAAWTLGWLMLLVHFAIAFGVAHAWSHAAAVEHVREVGGSGAGIVVNNLFAMVWGADVLWWWLNPPSRATRPHWVGYAVHGFLLFVVLNATVVFGPPRRQWVYAAAFGGLAVLWRTKRAHHLPGGEKQSTG